MMSVQNELTADRSSPQTSGFEPAAAPRVARTTLTAIPARLPLLAIFVVSLVVLLPRALSGFSFYDEGFITAGARLVSEGAVPYRDFWTIYGPAQFYLSAALLESVADDLTVLRLLHLTLLSAITAAIVVIARHLDDRHAWPLPILAGFGFLGLNLLMGPNAGYPAVGATLFLLLAAVSLVRAETITGTMPWLQASIAVGLAGLFRWDFGGYGLIALSGSATWIMFRRDRPAPPDHSRLIAATGPALALMAAAYLPLIALTGIARFYDDVLAFAVFEYPKWRDLHVLSPLAARIVQSIQDDDLGGFLKALAKASFYTFPIAVLGLSILHCVRAPSKPADGKRSPTVLATYLTVLLLLLALTQMRVRPGPAQMFPLYVLSFSLLGLAGHRIGQHSLERMARAAAVMAALACLGIAGISANRIWSPSHLALDTERATLIRVGSESEHYRELIQYVRSRTCPDAPLYSGALRHDRLFANDALLYFLTGRTPVTRFVEMHPGMANTLDAQKMIIAALEAKRPPLLVLLDLTRDEPNLASVGNGIHLLDDYITRQYRLDRRFGAYSVMQRKRAGGVSPDALRECSRLRH